MNLKKIINMAILLCSFNCNYKTHLEEKTIVYKRGESIRLENRNERDVFTDNAVMWFGLEKISARDALENYYLKGCRGDSYIDDYIKGAPVPEMTTVFIIETDRGSDMIGGSVFLEKTHDGWRINGLDLIHCFIRYF